MELAIVCLVWALTLLVVATAAWVGTAAAGTAVDIWHVWHIDGGDGGPGLPVEVTTPPRQAESRLYVEIDNIRAARRQRDKGVA